MKRVTAALAAMFGWFCLATVIAEATAAAYVVATMDVDSGALSRVLAVANDLDIVDLAIAIRPKSTMVDMAQVPPPEIVKNRAAASSDVLARKKTLENMLISLVALETNLEDEHQAYVRRRKAFTDELAVREEKAAESAFREVQITLEAISPKQAKDQIMKILDEGALEDVAKIIRAMAIDKRKKIFAEFKTEEEAGQLYEVLRELGEPLETIKTAGVAR